MTGTLKELIAQRKELDAQIQNARDIEMSSAVAQVRSIVAEFGLSQAEVFPMSRGGSRGKGGTVAPKYLNPTTGATWTGRGKPPAWIAGKDRAQFEIRSST